MVRVIVNEGQGPHTHEIDADRVTVGSTPDCDIVLQGPGTAGVQFTLEVTPTGHKVVVLTGEVLHNEEACDVRHLLHNDTLHVGESMVLYKNADASLPEGTGTPAPAADVPDVGALDVTDDLGFGNLDLSGDELEVDDDLGAPKVEDWDPAASDVVELGDIGLDDKPLDETADETADAEDLEEWDGLEELEEEEPEPEPEPEPAPAVAVEEPRPPAELDVADEDEDDELELDGGLTLLDDLEDEDDIEPEPPVTAKPEPKPEPERLSSPPPAPEPAPTPEPRRSVPGTVRFKAPLPPGHKAPDGPPPAHPGRPPA